MADSKRDYYEVLGIQKGASENEIKKAYHKKVREYHPDIHPNDPIYVEKTQEVNEAYEVLSNPEKKARYDQFGHAGVDPSYGTGGMGDMGGFGDMSDILENIFGSFGGFGFGGGSTRSTASAPRRGADITENINISFMEACNGVKKEVRINRMSACDACKGTGSTGGSTAEVCPDCQGRGSVRTVSKTPLGSFSSTKPCPHCNGKGKIIKNPCGKCRGAGRVRVPATESFTIPAGINDGQTLRLSNKGDCGINGGGAGDLLVNVSVKSHPIFRREHYDLYCDVPVTYAEAVLGAKITIPTIDGDQQYEIGEGTQTGTVINLKGKGVKKLNRTERGNQYVTLSVEVPRNLTKQQKEKLREFEDSLSEKNYTKRQNFFDKIKSMFENK